MHLKKTFSKVLTGVKKGYKESSKFVKTYGPSTHNRLSRMASGISQTFEVRPNPIHFRQRRFPGMRKRVPRGWRVY